MDVNRRVITRVYPKVAFLHNKAITLNIYFSLIRCENIMSYAIKKHFVICYFDFSISCVYSNFKIFKFKICIC